MPSPSIQCCKSITLLDAGFAHCFSALLWGGRVEEHKIVQIALFTIIFLTDCLKYLQYFKCGILLYSTHYATIIKVLIIFGTQTSSLNTWVSEAKSLFFRFFSSKTKFEHCKEYCTRCYIVHQIVELITYIHNLCNWE